MCKCVKEPVDQGGVYPGGQGVLEASVQRGRALVRGGVFSLFSYFFLFSFYLPFIPFHLIHPRRSVPSNAAKEFG